MHNHAQHTQIHTGITCSTTEKCRSSNCDVSTGGCLLTTVADGTGCDDDDPCTEGDSCTAGKCNGTCVLGEMCVVHGEFGEFCVCGAWCDTIYVVHGVIACVWCMCGG